MPRRSLHLALLAVLAAVVLPTLSGCVVYERRPAYYYRRVHPVRVHRVVVVGGNTDAPAVDAPEPDAG